MVATFPPAPPRLPPEPPTIPPPNPARRPHGEETLTKVRDLLTLTTLSHREIGRRTGVHASTVSRLARHCGRSRPAHPEGRRPPLRLVPSRDRRPARGCDPGGSAAPAPQRHRRAAARRRRGAALPDRDEPDRDRAGHRPGAAPRARRAQARRGG